ncbi:ABC transporter permease [Dactylosporangium sp. NPDC051541]|uniref:ABC transporter permease n=1 Tax=Dactylosporangium sp. NPDC051541 TaxID=3363977 RepID=UPI0037919491
MIFSVALADFRERVRRPAYLFMLISAIGLGLLAVPAVDSHWSVLVMGGYRGRYTSGYVGMVTALTSALWLTLVGFYLVRDAVARDERTGVGQLIAASPLRTWAYLLAKLLSNVAVLGSMTAVSATTAVVLQLLRGESMRVDLVALALPFVLIAFPMLVVTSAAALLFETTPLLRSGLGNVLWIFIWMVGTIAGQSQNAPFGGLGLRPVTLPAGASQDVGLGLMYVDEPLRAFDWPGLPVTTSFVLARAELIALAVAVALLPALWFGRFDRPARPDRPSRFFRFPAPRWGGPGLRLVAGETQILVAGTPLWWWLGAATLSLAGLTLPRGALLAIAWIWPVLIWSRLGTQAATSGTAAILAAYPSPRRRVLAEWTAGALLAAATGAGAAIRMAWASDFPGLSAWLAGTLFIPALALTSGTLTKAPRFFQAVYTLLWYLMINDADALNFMGILRDGRHPTGPGALTWTTLSLAGVLTTLAWTTVKQARR